MGFRSPYPTQGIWLDLDITNTLGEIYHVQTAEGYQIMSGYLLDPSRNGTFPLFNISNGDNMPEEMIHDNLERKYLAAMVVRFKREQNSQWEKGIGIGQDGSSHDLNMIVDMNHSPVAPPIWDYYISSGEGCFVISDPS